MFTKARLKLTGWYLLIIMLISGMFSVAIYRMLTSELERFARSQRFRIERRIQDDQFFPFNSPDQLVPLMIDTSLIAEAKEHLAIQLISINTIIFIVAGALGYFLAGRTLKPIKNMMDEQNRFISDASHEFRTPLTSLKSAFEVYLRGKKKSLKEATVLIAESVGEVNKMQKLSDSLLELAANQIPNHQFVSLSLSALIEEAARTVGPIAKKKNMTIELQAEPIDIEGAKQPLIDLWVILLDNAIKYSPTDSEINVAAKKADGNVRVEVVDHGMGIGDRDLPHIFDRFYRSDPSRTKSKIDGYGLGLSIAKQIVSSHYGSIRVVSTSKSGTTMLVILPIKQGNRFQTPTFFSKLSD